MYIPFGFYYLVLKELEDLKGHVAPGTEQNSWLLLKSLNAANINAAPVLSNSNYRLDTVQALWRGLVFSLWKNYLTRNQRSLSSSWLHLTHKNFTHTKTEVELSFKHYQKVYNYMQTEWKATYTWSVCLQQRPLGKTCFTRPGYTTTESIALNAFSA